MLSATAPKLFLDYLQQEYPLVLDEQWQAELVAEMRQVYGEKLVLVGQEGFVSLVTPQWVID